MNNEMRTTILTLCCMAALLMAAACSHEKEARAELDRARALYESQQYPAARNAIDTLRMRYPKELAVMKEALQLMRLVDRGECERNIAYCDSLIPVREKEVETLKQGFVLERDARYEDVGRYVRPEHAVERNIGRSYLRCGVNEQGEIFLASVYSGTAPINHTGLKITAPDGTYAVTAEIPYDGGVNYRFRDDGRTTEVVTYAGDNGIDAIRFVDGVEGQGSVRRDGAAVGGKGGGGDELVEDAVVEHEQEAAVGGVGLEAEEALGGVVSLHVAHVGRGDEAGVAVAVGFKADAAVEEDFEVGPDVRKSLRAGVADDGFDKDKHPGGDAGDTSHVGFTCALHDGADLGFPFVHEDDAARGYADEVNEWVEVLE